MYVLFQLGNSRAASLIFLIYTVKQDFPYLVRGSIYFLFVSAIPLDKIMKNYKSVKNNLKKKCCNYKIIKQKKLVFYSSKYTVCKAEIWDKFPPVLKWANYVPSLVFL